MDQPLLTIHAIGAWLNVDLQNAILVSLNFAHGVRHCQPVSMTMKVDIGSCSLYLWWNCSFWLNMRFCLGFDSRSFSLSHEDVQRALFLAILSFLQFCFSILLFLLPTKDDLTPVFCIWAHAEDISAIRSHNVDVDVKTQYIRASKNADNLSSTHAWQGPKLVRI